MGTSARSSKTGHYLDWARVGPASLGRYVVGSVLMVLAWAGGTLVIGIVQMAAPMDPEASAVRGLALLLGTFLLGPLAIPVVVRGLHRRPGWSVVTGSWPGRIRDVGRGAVIALTNLVILDAAACLVAPIRVAGWDAREWLVLAAVAVVGFLIQTGFEEFTFRGYLATYSTSPILVVGIPAVLFAGCTGATSSPSARTPCSWFPTCSWAQRTGGPPGHTGWIWLPLGITGPTTPTPSWPSATTATSCPPESRSPATWPTSAWDG